MLTTILSSSLLIAALLLFRRLLRGKINPAVQYALWLLVLVRLLVPGGLFAAVETPVSAANFIPARLEAAVADRTPADDDVRGGEAAGLQAEPEVRGGPALRRVLTAVWAGGSAVIAVWFVAVNRWLSRKLRQGAVRCTHLHAPIPVYYAQNIPSPCLHGLFRPAIYLNHAVWGNSVREKHALLHELCHYRHGDHWFTLLRNLCLVIYWFNPLVWAAAIAARQDSELACDRAVLRRLDDRESLEYGRTLIDLAAGRGGRANLLLNSTAMALGKNQLKSRIIHIARRPRTAKITGCLLALAVLAVTLITFTGAGDGPPAAAPAGTDGVEMVDGVEVAAGVDAPRQVVQEAVRRAAADGDYLQSLGSEISRVTVDELSLAYALEGMTDGVVEVYRLTYRLFPAEPDLTLLAGGMYLDEEGGLVDGSAPYAPLFIVNRYGDTEEYILGTNQGIFENPGNDWLNICQAIAESGWTSPSGHGLSENVINNYVNWINELPDLAGRTFPWTGPEDNTLLREAAQVYLTELMALEPGNTYRVLSGSAEGFAVVPVDEFFLGTGMLTIVPEDMGTSGWPSQGAIDNGDGSLSVPITLYLTPSTEGYRNISFIAPGQVQI